MHRLGVKIAAPLDGAPSRRWLFLGQIATYSPASGRPEEPRMFPSQRPGQLWRRTRPPGKRGRDAQRTDPATDPLRRSTRSTFLGKIVTAHAVYSSGATSEGVVFLSPR